LLPDIRPVSELDGVAPARWAWPIALIAAPSGKDWAVAGVAAIKEPPAMPAIKRKRAIMRTSLRQKAFRR
jgi:hypothetical protein